MSDESDVRASEARALAAPLVCGREREIESRMTSDEGAQLAASIAARAEDSNRDSMHAECILLHPLDVNHYAIPQIVLTALPYVLPLGAFGWYRPANSRRNPGGQA